MVWRGNLNPFPAKGVGFFIFGALSKLEKHYRKEGGGLSINLEMNS